MNLESLFVNLYITLFLLCKSFAFTVMVPDSILVDTPQTGFSMNNEARTDPQEQEAVYEIMKATGNDWATRIPDVCKGRWHGIECMPDRDQIYHITSLSFGALSDDTALPSCNPLNSFISPSVTKLPHLKSLFFYRCFTSNTQKIPSFLGELGLSLHNLVLRENAHIGKIPEELGNLTSLQVLDLHGNNLVSGIPISLSRLARLRSLDLSGNRLSGMIHSSLKFAKLSVLDLSCNRLQGLIPNKIAESNSLLKMDLSRNCFSGQIPEFFGLGNLLLLDLSYNQLTQPIPNSLRKLNSLQVLNLRGNPMNSKLSEEIFIDMKDLMILILSDVGLYGKIPESLGELQSLRVLHLDQNRLNGSIPTSFKNLNQLTELRINDNYLTGPIPFTRDQIWKLRKKLRLFNNPNLCYDSELYPQSNGTQSSLSYLGIDDCKMGSFAKTRTSPQRLN